MIDSKKGNPFFGPGHNGEIVTLDGRNYLPFHCHVQGKKPHARPLFIRELTWDAEGWPHATLGAPPAR